MKKVLIGVGAVVLLVLGFFGAVMASAFAGNAEIVDGAEPVPGVRQVKDGFVSFFVLEAGDGQVVLIDAGTDPEGKALLAELARRKLGPDAVKAIFLTHGHGDHLAAVHLFPKADVYGFGAEAGLMDGTAGPRGPIVRFFGKKDSGVRFTHLLADGESTNIGPLTVKAFLIPGHTQGSAAYLARGVLFLGDSAAATSEGKLKGAVWAFSDDAAQAKASLAGLLNKLDPKEVTFLAPAHTAPLKGLGPLQALTQGK
ncbi:MAG: MBL fold metallo-hydrolase [Deltaproteobacteria bacterium]|nr:MBL fold metallo-hydrolase [Deltaproteobacteria bacterium]